MCAEQRTMEAARTRTSKNKNKKHDQKGATHTSSIKILEVSRNDQKGFPVPGIGCEMQRSCSSSNDTDTNLFIQY